MRNRIKCLVCNTVIESKSLHDYQECGCENMAFVDGGQMYSRWGAMKPSKIVRVLDDDSTIQLPIRG